MLYREYREKLYRRGWKILRLWKFRLLFLTGFLLLLAGVGALLGVAGTVYDVEVPESVVYGTPLSPAAKSTFGKPKFEYRPVGGEWTSEEPRAAGEYECRAVGTSVARTARPGQIFRYTVLPRESALTIMGDSLVYGEQPDYSADLQYGDTLSVPRLSTVYEGGWVEAEVDLAAVRVYSKEGEDVTSSYVFSTEKKHMVDEHRPVTIETETREFEYDGAPHTAAAFRIAEGSLVEGHSYLAAFPTLTNAGSRSNVATDVHILDENGVDVTEHYHLKYKTGTVSVLPRKITVQTASREFVYDGAPHPFAEDTLAVTGNFLPEGHTLSLVGSAPVFTDAGDYSNRAAVTVTADGESVGANYKIEYDYGAVRILKRKIAIATDTASYYYDGQTRTYTGELVEGSPAAGQTLTFEDTLTVSEAGVYENRLRAVLWDGAADRAENYAVEERFGVIEIKKRNLRIQTKDQTWEYDGARHEFSSSDAYELLSSDEEGYGLIGDHAVYLRSSAAARITNAGDMPNDLLFGVRGTAGTETGNYAIEVLAGTLTVTPRKVSLRTQSGERVYNGAPQRIEGYEVSSGNFVNTSDRVVAEYAAYTDVGEGENSFVNARVLRGSADVSANYTLDPQWGTVTITRRVLTQVTTPTMTASYNGTVQDTWSGARAQNLVTGHRLESYDRTEFRLPCGATENKMKFRVRNGNGADVTENYSIPEENITYGKVTILTRRITLRTDDGEWTYDGEPHENSGYTVTSSMKLVAGHTVTAEYTSVKDAGTQQNVFNSLRILDAAGEEVTEYYSVTKVWGTLTVRRRPITIATESKSWTYDGEAHKWEEYGDVTQYLVEGHVFEGSVLSAPSLTDAGSRLNTFSVSFTVMAGGDDVTGNYQISYAYGTLTVDPRSITVTTPTLSWVYDDTAHDTWSEVSADDLVGDHTLSPEGYTRFIDVAQSGKNQFAVLVKSGGADMTKNYAISYSYGTVTVEPRPVLVTTPGSSWVYDDTAHDTWSEVKASALPARPESGLVGGHTLSPEGYTRFINVAQSGENQFTVRVMKGGDDVTGNYQISYSYGAVTITRRPILVTTPGSSWIYDDTAHDTWSEVSADDLVGGHALSPEGYTRFIDVAQSGENQFTVRVIKGGGDVTENYQISYSYGTVTISLRPVTLSTGDGSWVYDADPHSAPTVLPEGEGENRGLLTAHSFVASGVTGVPEVIEVKDSCPNEFTFTPLIRDAEGENVTANYAVEIEYGTVTITPRPVTFRTGDGSWVYDADPHSAPTVLPEEEGEDRGLLNAQRLEAAVSEQTWITNVLETAEGNNRLTFTPTFWSAEGKDVTANYLFDVEETAWGTLTITPRPVTLFTGDGSWLYDADPHTVPWAPVPREGSFAKDHRILGSCRTETDAGDYENTPSPTGIFSGSEKIDDENYEITWEWGTLTITRRPVTVRTGSDSWVFDGTVHKVDHDFSVTDENPGGQIEGHVFSPTYTVTLQMAGTFANQCKVEVTDKEGGIVTNNYEFITEFGTVVIARRPVKIETKSRTWVYDGAEHSYYGEEALVIEEEGEDRGFLFALGYSLLFISDSSRTFVKDITDTETEVGTVPNVLNPLFWHGDKNATNSYEIEWTYGELRVKSPVVVQPYGASKTYDGTPLEQSGWRVLQKPPDIEREWISFGSAGSITEPGVLTRAEAEENLRGSGRIFNGTEDLTAENRIDCGGPETVLEVKKRVLSIATLSLSQVNDGASLFGGGEGTYWIAHGKLLEGHTLRCEVTGVLDPSAASAPNTLLLENVHIFDEKTGEDVAQKYYDIRISEGTLSWIEPDRPEE